MQAAGICMGASNVSIITVQKNEGTIVSKEHISQFHEGNVRKTLNRLIEENGLSNLNKLAVTGRKFKSLVKLPEIAEPEATELAYDYIKDKYGNADVIVSAGGETFMVYELNDEGRIINVYTGNKCASGTGEFFFQQIKRMGLDLEKANEIAKIDNPHRVSGRCSVFCKSDCTHALNKGEDKGRIVAGLCEMMVDKIMELLTKCDAQKIMMVGGTSRNKIMVEYLQNKLDEVIIPEEATYFEALGTAIWALENGDSIKESGLFDEGEKSFDFLPPLQEYRDQVTFHTLERDKAREGDRCLVGLDVGSTTTKAVIVREEDKALLASVYLRTEGDPVNASRKCYQQLTPQLKGKQINIIGLGVTGSGRQIAGLHALTDSVINEIIAHATGAVHFDPGVDTIFEIGGQDAKYTYLINQVPTDYAMNEACSAGTGSFLEESAYESLNIEMEDIAGMALRGNKPPNFNDQCAAFISSDIKNAVQEGIEIEDICAGLVYSICMNYSNRVKGNRAVGDKVFMQGGVCYNEAVPIAMAALTDKDIIVPPEPGLMGAYGVALVVKQNLDLGLVAEKEFNLEELASREVKYCEPFICNGGKEDCDRECEINVLEIDGNKYPFGGICNKYVNMNKNVEYDVRELDLVRRREEMVFEDYFVKPANDSAKGKIGINRSLAVNSLLPLYSRFFSELGYEVVLPDKARESGRQQQAAAFCFPVELSHGYMEDLLKKETDYIFSPHVKGLYVNSDSDNSILCPMAQGEPYYLQSVWPQLKSENTINPVLDFKGGYENAEKQFVETGNKLGCSRRQSRQAFAEAVRAQHDFENSLKEIGTEVLKNLENNPGKRAIVAFGRPYNALTSVANMGIAHKFASSGEKIIPFDMLPLDSEKAPEKMYWSMGQLIMKGAKIVSEHPQLFGVYITNFSCGPDSFIVEYFREEHGQKPSLTLELDSHTADAGLDTRIEAFLDVVDSYLKLQKQELQITNNSEFKPASISYENNDITIYDSQGKPHELTDDRVHLLIPSMGGLMTEAFTAAIRYNGVKVTACDPPGEIELKTGRANCSGKECLPLQLTLGSLLNYLEERDNDNELLVYFMPEASGPCRFGQYNVLMNNVIQRKQIENVALLTLTSANSYAGLGRNFTIRAWQALLIGDMLNDIYSALLTLAHNRQQALAQFNESKQKIFKGLAGKSWSDIKEILSHEADKLNNIPLVKPYEEAPKAALTGEIYVRSDEFSRQHLVKRLAEKGIITRVSPANEWLYYIDYLLQNSLMDPEPSLKMKLKNKIEGAIKKKFEKDVKNIMSRSGLCESTLTDVSRVINVAEDLISPELTGEAILTVGATIDEIIDEVDGVIAIGPFGCMPNRVAESIISETLEEQKEKLAETNSRAEKILEKFSSLPFLAIETDGNVFPQVIEARLEAFCLQVKRLSDYSNSLDEDEAQQIL